MRSPAATTDVSVIVPVYKATSTLARCLGSLLTQTLAPDRYEILAVLCGPDDGSRRVVEQLRDAYPRHTVRLLDSPVASAGAARNTGLNHARGANIAFVDADDWVSDNYLAELLAVADDIHLPISGLVDAAQDGTVDENTAVMASLAAKEGDYFQLHRDVSVVSNAVGKLYPASFLRSHRYDEDLASGEDAVFNGTLFSTFEHRFTEFDRRPYLRGARYFHHSSSAAAGALDTFDFCVKQRIEVLTRITAGPQGDPEDRIKLIRTLVRGQTEVIRSYLAARPEDHARGLQLLADSGVRGIRGFSLTSGVGQTWPDYDATNGVAQPWRPPQGVLLVSGSAAAINRLTEQILFLRQHGVAVRLAYYRGKLKRALGKRGHLRFALVREGRAAPPPAENAGLLDQAKSRLKEVRRRALRFGRLNSPRLLPGRVAVRIAGRVDAEGRQLLARPQLVVTLDDGGIALTSGNDVDVDGVECFHAWVLAMASQAPATPSQANEIARSAETLAQLSVGDPSLPPPRVWAIAAWRMLRARQLGPAMTIAKLGRKLFPDSIEAELFDMLKILEQVIERMELPEQAVAQSEHAAQAADRALDEGDVHRAAFIISVTCEALFAQDHTTNVPRPPVLTDPDGLLRGLRTSRTWGLLETSSPSTAVRGPIAKPEPSVLVLPGAYPRFDGVVHEALAGHADVERLPLGEVEREYRTTAVSPLTIFRRLAYGVGLGVDIDEKTALSFARSDVVFADWADKGAVIASMATPPDTRLIVRFHGVDSLSVWQFLVDWGRVDDVVFVSEHVRRSVEKVLGDRISHTRKHVLGNGVDLERFTAPSTPDAHRRLGMVGWAQKVKDPIWTVEVLALLRAEDPSWRLRLIGKDFEPRTHGSEYLYSEAFRARALRDDVRGAIEYVGFTTDLPRHLAGVGFAVSSSVRESFHIGAMEIVGSQAVPVFRNWPVYREFGGARDLLPNGWVVETPQDAAQRILAHADRDVWEQASATARDEARKRFKLLALSDAYRQIILG